MYNQYNYVQTQLVSRKCKMLLASYNNNICPQRTLSSTLDAALTLSTVIEQCSHAIVVNFQPSNSFSSWTNTIRRTESDGRSWTFVSYGRTATIGSTLRCAFIGTAADVNRCRKLYLLRSRSAKRRLSRGHSTDKPDAI